MAPTKTIARLANKMKESFIASYWRLVIGKGAVEI